MEVILLRVRINNAVFLRAVAAFELYIQLLFYEATLNKLPILSTLRTLSIPVHLAGDDVNP
jgi:hypothetical protein